jgi:hypothetical protein
MCCHTTRQVVARERSCTLTSLMDRQTTFLLALGMLIAAALAVGVSGWVLVVRDRALERAGHVPGVAAQGDAHHREGRKGS